MLAPKHWYRRFCALAWFLAVSGCWERNLPEAAEVTLPDGTAIQALKGTGPPSLANTRWACYRLDDDRFIVRVEFGPNGEVARFYDNALYFPEILGTELIPDDLVRPAAFPGLTYAAASYGGENESGFGFAARLNIWFLGLQAGNGSAYAFGIRNGDRLDGAFGYVTEVTLVEGSPFVSGLSDEYEFYALRE